MPDATVARTESEREIRVLPPLVVDQIAAGEVVERPASVVKELLDNAIDAGASSITVDLERGGIELVRVGDDGCGVGPAQMPLMVAPHATSKIRGTEDLDRIATMGFRGEALASIASVSRLSIRSRPAGEDAAARLEVEGGSPGEIRPDAGPVGTSVTVRNLFFNTPARRKFVKTVQTEQGHCVDVVRAIAMSHPAIGFTLKADGRELLALAKGQGPRARAMAILGGELDSQFLEVGADRFDDARGVALWGLAGLPVLAAATAKKQHVFLNGRPIRDRTVQHAVREAYRGLIEPGKHPACVLMLEMDPGAVDVNVHPAKAEVRFRDSGAVHKTVYLAVREALQRADLTPRVAMGADGARDDAGGERFRGRFEPVGPGERINASAGASEARERFVDYFKRFVPDGEGRGFDYEGLRSAIEREREQVEREHERLELERRRLAEGRAGDERAEEGGTGADPAPPGDEHLRASRVRDTPGQAGLEAATPRARILQVHNSFLVTQDEQGVVIIDQHALHERVMFEKLKERLSSGSLESQRLLMPVIVDTTAQRVDLVEALSREGGLLERLGIALEPAGPTAVSVQAFPTFLFDRKVDPKEFVDELLEKAEDENLAETGGADVEEGALHEILDMMACKAAVKAGDALSESELAELLLMREQVERSSNCPHGRPTAIRLTIRELEKQFGRM